MEPMMKRFITLLRQLTLSSFLISAFPIIFIAYAFDSSFLLVQYTTLIGIAVTKEYFRIEAVLCVQSANDVHLRDYCTLHKILLLVIYQR